MFECKICNKQTSVQKEMVGRVCEKCFEIERPVLSLVFLIIWYLVSFLVSFLLIQGIYFMMTKIIDKIPAHGEIFVPLLTPTAIIAFLIFFMFVSWKKDEQKTWDKKFL